MMRHCGSFVARVVLHQALLVAGLTLGLILGASPARADLTVFGGFSSPSLPRPTIGFSLDFLCRMVCLEAEWARTAGGNASRYVATTGLNVFVNFPATVNGVQWYATGGFGTYSQSSTRGYPTAKNIGVGTKLPLVGPLKVRLDYRVYFVNLDETQSRPASSFHSHRVTSGLSLAF